MQIKKGLLLYSPLVITAQQNSANKLLNIKQKCPSIYCTIQTRTAQVMNNLMAL